MNGKEAGKETSTKNPATPNGRVDNRNAPGVDNVLDNHIGNELDKLQVQTLPLARVYQCDSMFLTRGSPGPCCGRAHCTHEAIRRKTRLSTGPIRLCGCRLSYNVVFRRHLSQSHVRVATYTP